MVEEYYNQQAAAQNSFANLKFLFFHWRKNQVVFQTKDDLGDSPQKLLSIELSKIFWFFGFPISLEWPNGICLEKIAFHEGTNGSFFHGDAQFARMTVLYFATHHANFKKAAKELFAFHHVLQNAKLKGKQYEFNGEKGTMESLAEAYSLECDLEFDEFL